MPKFRRTDRINEQLKQEISLLIRDNVRDPRVGLATITGVQTSPELDHAKVYFTALGDEDERKEILSGLRSAAPFIRHELGKRLHMRRIPELHFETDRVLAEALRIERLLSEALPKDTVPADSGDPDDSADSDDPAAGSTSDDPAVLADSHDSADSFDAVESGASADAIGADHPSESADADAAAADRNVAADESDARDDADGSGASADRDASPGHA